MLTELNIKNFAIIDNLNITFTDGFNVISGETGAGKSIIIGAVNLLLGDRASADMIRTNEDAAVVEALFDIRQNSAARKKMEALGLDEADVLAIRRIVSRSGKNRCHINGSLVTLSSLADVGESLMNICGQHEHQALLNADCHLDILDEFGLLMPLRTDYTLIFQHVQRLRERRQKLADMSAKRAEREDFLHFQLREIAAVGPSPGEDETLLQEKKRLNNIQKLMDSAQRAYEDLYGKGGSILEDLKRTIAEIKEIKGIDDQLSLNESEMEAVYFQLEDAAFVLRDYLRRLSFDPERLACIDERLEALGRLKRKHGGTIEAISAKKVAIENELGSIEGTDSELADLTAQLETASASMKAKALRLSQNRHEQAKLMEMVIKQEIGALQMGAARFEVRFGNEPAFNERGTDICEFYLSTNQGEALKPLNRVASGGELSRIILAMKKALARTGAVSTIVFDEVDSGIGGATAEIVGAKLKEVAQYHQVLCITHLPQIACFGDRHYRVAKSVADGRSRTYVEMLSQQQRHDEIARMLGGIEMTDKTRAHAREMLEKAGGKGR